MKTLEHLIQEIGAKILEQLDNEHVRLDDLKGRIDYFLSLLEDEEPHGH